MADIKPIETFYNGYRFRSRLEARWAVYFDSLGIEYEYEPEGYELSDGTKYLPDFYLTSMHMFVEVKAENIDDKRRIFAMHKLVELYRGDCFSKFGSGIIVSLVVGDPMNNDMSCYCNFDKSFEAWFGFYFARGCEVECSKGKFVFNDDVITINVRGMEREGMYYNSGFDSLTPLLNDYEITSFYDLDHAAKQARQARFEHGECGI